MQDDLQPKIQDRTTVRAVERAFKLLGYFGMEQETLTLSEAARSSNLPISTVSRLLGTLEANDFVRRLPDGRYLPGGRLLRIGVAALHGVPLYDLSLQHLERLSKVTGETANLGVPVAGDQVLYLRQAISSHPIRHGAWLGRTVPIAGTAIGDAIIGRVGSGGYCMTRATIETDVTALAAPVYGADQQIVAALSITGPTYRMTDIVISGMAEELLREARAMSSHLGAPANARKSNSIQSV